MNDGKVDGFVDLVQNMMWGNQFLHVDDLKQPRLSRRVFGGFHDPFTLHSNDFSSFFDVSPLNPCLRVYFFHRPSRSPVI
ncbi:hypothetical protein HNR34_001968 [Geobacillus subterraneus]